MYVNNVGICSDLRRMVKLFQMCRVGLVAICSILAHWLWLWTKIWTRGYFINYTESSVKVTTLPRWNFIDCLLKNEFDVISPWNVWKLIPIPHQITFLDGVISPFPVSLCFLFTPFFVGVAFKGVVFEGVALFLAGVVFMGDTPVSSSLFMSVPLSSPSLLLSLSSSSSFKGFFFGVPSLELGMRSVVSFDFLKRVCKTIFKVWIHFQELKSSLKD